MQLSAESRYAIFAVVWNLLFGPQLHGAILTVDRMAATNIALQLSGIRQLEPFETSAMLEQQINPQS